MLKSSVPSDVRDSLAELRGAMVDVANRMYDRGYIVASDGNLSVRVSEDCFLVTPTGARKAHLRPDDLVLCDRFGKALPGESGRPSSEFRMHLSVYEVRDDVQAVVHAHPPYAVAHTVARLSLQEPLVPEAFCLLGDVLTIPYATPTTGDLAEALRQPIRTRQAVMLERHGSVTVGRTLFEAYDRLEVLEHTAKISFLARLLAKGQVEGLARSQLEALALTSG